MTHDERAAYADLRCRANLLRIEAADRLTPAAQHTGDAEVTAYIATLSATLKALYRRCNAALVQADSAGVGQ